MRIATIAKLEAFFKPKERASASLSKLQNQLTRNFKIGKTEVTLTTLQIAIEKQQNPENEITAVNNAIMTAVDQGARIIQIPNVQLSAVYKAIAYAALHGAQIVSL